MQSIILTGSESLRNDYIQKFIKDNNILPFNTTYYIDTLKIQDVRSLQQKLSISSRSQNRLFVLPETITLDAQNALLKTLEEVPLSTFIIISANSANFLPTILSRCKIVRLTQELSYSLSEKEVRDVLSTKSLSSFLLFVEKITLEKSSVKDTFVELLFVMRIILVDSYINNKDKELQSYIAYLLNEFLDVLPLVENNNVNVRMVLEDVFLTKNFYIAI